MSRHAHLAGGRPLFGPCAAAGQVLCGAGREWAAALPRGGCGGQQGGAGGDVRDPAPLRPDLQEESASAARTRATESGAEHCTSSFHEKSTTIESLVHLPSRAATSPPPPSSSDAKKGRPPKHRLAVPQIHERRAKQRSSLPLLVFLFLLFLHVLPQLRLEPSNATRSASSSRRPSAPPRPRRHHQ